MECASKLRFATKQLAQSAADSYMARIALTFAPMTAYSCASHGCWHIGHDRFYPASHIKEYANDCAARHKQSINPPTAGQWNPRRQLPRFVGRRHFRFICRLKKRSATIPS